MSTPQIEIGTSGWKFDDWAGIFYPFRVPQTKWLEYYSARFSLGEVNSTYYHLGSVKSFDAISKRTPEDFKIFVKVHSDVTHVRKGQQESLERLKQVTEPLQESGKLLGFVAQFPESFYCTEENRKYILSLGELCASNRLCVEFRHKSWDSQEMLQELQSNSLTWICPDEPAIGNLLPFDLKTSTDIIYLRLHGRNSKNWYNSTEGDRYDYDYSTQELTSIGQAIRDQKTPAKKIFILFNNCHYGRAPQNAQWLKDWFTVR